MPKHTRKNGKGLGSGLSPDRLKREFSKQGSGHNSRSRYDPEAIDNTARPVIRYVPRSEQSQQSNR